MRSDTLTIPTHDATSLHTYRWLPDGDPKAVVVVAHGMVEHAARYARLAQSLTDSGYAVYAADHRGHGRTAGEGQVGHLGDGCDFGTVVEDLERVIASARQDHPDAPLFVLGHSFGTFVARTYAARHSHDLAGLVLSGTAGDAGLLGRVGKVVAGLEARLRGGAHQSTLMDRLTFGAFNKPFEGRTDFDWLSRDTVEVDAYVADPSCGVTASSAFFATMIDGIGRVNRPQVTALVRKDLPIHLIAGAEDPVGNRGRGVEQVAGLYRQAGLRDVTLKLYPGARHEVFNETNRDEVTADVIAWLDAHTP